MKKVVLFLSVLLMTVTLSAQLVWRGYTEFPVDIKLVEKGTMIAGANNGDTIFSYFTVNGVNYASWFGICSMSKGTVAKALGDSGLDIQTGFGAGDDINYATKTNGVHRKVQWLSSYEKSQHTLWVAQLTEEIVNIQDNPYYSLDPVWPEFEDMIQPYSKLPTTNFSDRYLHQYIQWNKYLPLFYDTWAIELVEGTGKFKPSAKFPSNSTYQFSKLDIQNRLVIFRVTVKALPNSNSTDLSRIIRLTW